STDNNPWDGGADELWSRAALHLAAEGFAVFASVIASSPPHRRVLDLTENGIEVWLRPLRYRLQKRAWRFLTRHVLTRPQKDYTTSEVERLIAARSPDLVVISDGGLDLIEMCATKRLRFVTIVQCNSYFWWPGRPSLLRCGATLFRMQTAR